MSNRVLRAGFVAVPALCLALALASAACDEDDPAATGPDASVDVTPLPDASSNPYFDASVQSDSGDGGAGDPDADAAPPAPLCEIYPDSEMSDVDAAVGERLHRYDLIAHRAMSTAAVNARGTCEIANYFTEEISEAFLPIAIDCLGRELATIAGCKLDGTNTALNYETNALDGNLVKCVNPDDDPDFPGAVVRLGFRKPDGENFKVKRADADKLIALVTAQAVATGKMTVADAARLKAGLEARRDTVVVPAAEDDGQYSDSSCEPPNR